MAVWETCLILTLPSHTATVHLRCAAPPGLQHMQEMLTLTTRMNALARITLGNVNIAATTALQVGVVHLFFPATTNISKTCLRRQCRRATNSKMPSSAGHRRSGQGDCPAAWRQHSDAHLDPHQVPRALHTV